jgi:hypothetical protein
MDRYTAQDSDRAVLNGTTGAVMANDTFDRIRITNRSVLDLVLGNITPANSGAAATVTITSENPQLTFDVSHQVSTTDIRIESVGDVVLNGVIDNPIGATTILSTGGDIVDGASGFVRTNTFVADAAGSIGTAANRFTVDLVRTAGRATGFTADADGDIALELEGHLREAAGTNPTFNADRIAAGGHVDVQLHAAVDDTASAATYGAVVVNENGVIGSFFNHFKPDEMDEETPPAVI